MRLIKMFESCRCDVSPARGALGCAALKATVEEEATVNKANPAVRP